MKRYKCPRCEVGRNAPGRMAPDDVRRFCLPCSEATGKLVTMACPARETAKARTKAKAKAKRDRDREKERQKYLLHDGSDARDIVKELQALKVWKDEGGQVLKRARAWKLETTPGLLSSIKDQARFSVASNILLQMTWAASSAVTMQSGRDAEARLFYKLGAAEYFGLSRRQIERHAKVATRLNGKDAPDIWDLQASVLALLKAGHPRPKG